MQSEIINYKELKSDIGIEVNIRVVVKSSDSEQMIG